MGTATVVLSIVVAYLFCQQARGLGRGDSWRLSNALSWQLCGEAIIGMGTLTFSFAAHKGWLNEWSIELQSALRFLMFLATSLTTLHLYITIKRIGR